MTSCQALFYPVATVGGGAFSEDVKPLGLDILWRADHMGTYATESYTG
jgi:hypothetical protein